MTELQPQAMATQIISEIAVLSKPPIINYKMKSAIFSISIRYYINMISGNDLLVAKSLLVWLAPYLKQA